MERRPERTDPLLITGGDPAGVGTELLAALAPRIAAVDRPVVYFCTAGDDHIDTFVERSGNPEYCSVDEAPPTSPQTRRVVIVPVGDAADRNHTTPGVPSPRTGNLALTALNAAVNLSRRGTAGLLTAPLSKEWVALGGAPGFSGHTGHLAAAFDCSVLMLMHGESVSVIPLTIHIPLRDVPERLQEELADVNLRRLLGAVLGMESFRGRRAVILGLNPHAGEGGHLGREEVDWLNDVVTDWRAQGIPVDGPIPADAAFLPGLREEFRLFLGCYHDQVLTPFKALEGRRGINVTIGLPFLRASPDHGTGFGIAGKGRADIDSMLLAWEFLLANSSPEVIA